MKECSICYEPILEKSKKTICGHIYHTSCLKKWVELGHDTCPLCRTDIVNDETTKLIRQFINSYLLFNQKDYVKKLVEERRDEILDGISRIKNADNKGKKYDIIYEYVKDIYKDRNYYLDIFFKIKDNILECIDRIVIENNIGSNSITL